jgi:hypothetical protein
MGYHAGKIVVFLVLSINIDGSYNNKRRWSFKSLFNSPDLLMLPTTTLDNIQ